MKDENKQQAWWQPALIMFGKVSVWVAVPIIISLFLGRYLDNHFNTAPWLFILSTIIALTVSVVAVTRICLEYIHTLEKETKNKVVSALSSDAPKQDESTKHTK